MIMKKHKKTKMQSQQTTYMKTRKTPFYARHVRIGNLLLALLTLTLALLINVVPLSASDQLEVKKDDAAITSQIKASLLFHLLLDTRTETKDGVVTLSGSAGTVADKELSSKIASETAGVKKVLNHMTLPVALAGNGQ